MKQRTQIQVVPRVTIVTDLLKNARGRFITTTHVKTDGSLRTINGRFGVHKNVTGRGMNHDPASYGQHVISEVVRIRDARGRFSTNYLQYRTVNLNTLTRARFNGKVLIASEAMHG